MRSRGLLALLLLSATLLGAVIAQPVQQASAQTVACTTCQAYVTESLNLRSTPSSSGTVLAVMPAGSAPVWYPLNGITDTGYVNVSYGSYSGWAFADYMILYPSNGTTTAALNLRSGAGTGYSVLAVIPYQGAVIVLGGPTSNGWYNVSYNGTNGYVIGTYLAFKDYNVSFYPGDVLTASAGLRLRSGAGTGYSVIAALPGGTNVTIISGPTFANTYSWYRVSTAYGTGYVAGDFLN